MPIDFSKVLKKGKAPEGFAVKGESGVTTVEKSFSPEAGSVVDAEFTVALVQLDVNSVKPRFEAYLERIAEWEIEINALEVIDDGTATTATAIGGEAHKALKAIKTRREEVTEDARKFVAGVDGFLKPFKDQLEEIKRIAERKISELKYRQKIKAQEEKAAADRAARELQEKLNREAEEKNRKAQEEARKAAEEEAERKRKLAEEEAERMASEEAAREHLRKTEEENKAAIEKAVQAEAKNAIVAPTVAAAVVPEADTLIKTEMGTSSYGKEPWVCEIEDETLIPREYCLPSQALLNKAVREGVRKIPGCNIRQKYRTNFRG